MSRYATRPRVNRFEAIFGALFVAGCLILSPWGLGGKFQAPATAAAKSVETIIPADLPVLDINNPIVTESCRLPDGDIFLTKPIKATNLEKINIVGGNRSRIRWRGTEPVNGIFNFIGVRKGSIGGDGPLGFEIIVESTGVNAAVLIANSPIPGGFISSGIQVRNVNVRHGGSQVAAKYGFSIDSHIEDPTGVHGFNNNENHRFFDCGVESCLVAAFHVRGHQCYDISFRDCVGIDAGRVVSPRFTTQAAAIAWAETSEYKDNYYIAGGGSVWQVASRAWIYGVYIESGASVILKNCNFNRCEVDVFMGWPCARATFEGHNSEHSRAFVSNMKWNPFTNSYLPATSGDYYVHARDVRMQCEPKKGTDAVVVRMCGHGPITITNSFFVGINGMCPRIECINYARYVNGVSGATIPQRGVLDLNGVYIGQNQGRLPIEPIFKTPFTWTVRAFGCEHKFIKADGGIDWRPITANELLPQNPNN